MRKTQREYQSKYKKECGQIPIRDTDPLSVEERRKVIISRLSRAEGILPSLRDRTAEAFKKAGKNYRPMGGW